MNTPAVRGVDRIIAFVAAVLKLSLIAATAVMVGCIALQVVMRYVFGRTPSWSEEVAVLMFAWATMGGLALGVYEGFHVRLDFLVKLAPEAGRVWYERGLDCVVAAFGAYLAWSGERFLDMTSGSVSAAIGYLNESGGIGYSAGIGMPLGGDGPVLRAGVSLKLN